MDTPSQSEEQEDLDSAGNHGKDEAPEEAESNSRKVIHRIGDEPSIKPDAVEMEDPNEVIRHKAVPVNCTEKIVIFLDISSEMANASLTASREETFLEYVKETLLIFLATKKTLNPSHQYALALMQNGSVFWYQEFTNDIEFIEEIILELEPTEPHEDDKEKEFYLDGIVQILKEHCTIPEVTDILLPPPYIVRCIIIYGRSHCMLKISQEQRQVLHRYKDSPFFFLDILYIHDPPSADNKSQAIYDFFCNLDKDETGYVLEVSNSVQRLYDHMAKLLCHPLQRCTQTEAYYDLIPFENSTKLDNL